MEQSQRIQTSLLNPIEKKALIFMAERMPRWVTSDMLTYFGIFGALVIAAGYLLSNFNYQWLWLSSLGFVMHWLGDSLDGTLARVRQEQRPLYGFYLDHNVDCITEFFMFGGFGLSPFLHFWIGLLILVPYLSLEVYVMINAHLKNEFKLTYGKLGPTEFRVAIIIINTLLICIPWLREWSTDVSLMGYSDKFMFLDFFGIGVFAFISILYFTSLISDGRYFAKIDPKKKK